jgi:hypothetical protein
VADVVALRMVWSTGSPRESAAWTLMLSAGLVADDTGNW